MKKTALVAMAVVAAASALAAEKAQRAAQTVIVCLQADQNIALVTRPIVERAQVIANRIFVSAGVRIEWHGNPRFCTAGPVAGILINLADHTPRNEFPEALAYAQPFEGGHVRVFYDRIYRAVNAGVLPYLLAHVLAHEITHILQATGQHAESGVMKAHWDASDYRLMTRQPLTFTEFDLQLIRHGLEARASASSIKPYLGAVEK